jgi:hypothetical protein
MSLRSIAFIALSLDGWSFAARAAELQDAILPASITFATSTGYWEDDGSAPTVEHAPAATQPAGSKEPETARQPRHGYYKLFAVRQADRTAKVYLQQITQTDDGPNIVSTVELQELNDLKPYVTDIRPENSTGILKEPGLFATVFLKTDPDADAESWTVIIDEFGDVTVGKASN